MTNEERIKYLEGFFACKSVDACSRFFITDCLSRARNLSNKLLDGAISEDNRRAVQVRIETYLAEAETEIKRMGA